MLYKHCIGNIYAYYLPNKLYLNNLYFLLHVSCILKLWSSIVPNDYCLWQKPCCDDSFLSCVFFANTHQVELFNINKFARCLKTNYDLLQGQYSTRKCFCQSYKQKKKISWKRNLEDETKFSFVMVSCSIHSRIMKHTFARLMTYHRFVWPPGVKIEVSRCLWQYTSPGFFLPSTNCNTCSFSNFHACVLLQQLIAAEKHFETLGDSPVSHFLPSSVRLRHLFVTCASPPPLPVIFS